jgi:hypothetical protein
MTTRGKRWLIGSALVAILTTLSIAAAARIPFSSDILRDRLIQTLADRLDADVALGTLTLRLLPALHVEGTNLTIRHRGRTDVPPLITVRAFTVDARLLEVWRRHAGRVVLQGLAIQIPPGDERESDGVAMVGRPAEHVATGPQVVVDELIADDATLAIIRRDPAKPPRIWRMHRLRMQSVSASTRMPFQAVLTNAIPPGEIVTEGAFGPWHRDDPGHTPLEGRFLFENADLSVFKGISGTLTANGTYEGSLDTIEVHGRTETPDFTVTVGGHPVPLHTRYHAVVDGTNGNTRLERIDASFLETALTAKGGVLEVEGVKGREVILDVTIDKGRLEDVMRLAVDAPRPPMTGALQLSTKFVLPPGEADVVDKLQLDGSFRIEGGRFTDAEVQRQINDMSRRARGALDEARTRPRAPAVVSDFHGRFVLADGALRLPTLVFDIPGAAVRLSGQYTLRTGRLAFGGNLYMDAKVSQTVTGWKSLLLRMADPFFRRDGQTVVPIRVTGTRHTPSFGVDVGRIFN